MRLHTPPHPHPAHCSSCDRKSKTKKILSQNYLLPCPGWRACFPKVLEVSLAAYGGRREAPLQNGQEPSPPHRLCSSLAPACLSEPRPGGQETLPKWVCVCALHPETEDRERSQVSPPGCGHFKPTLPGLIFVISK